MHKLTLKERTLLAERLKSTHDFLSYFIKVAMIRPELSTSSIKNGNDLIEYLDNVPEALPDGFGFNVIIKIYNYAKDSGLDTEPGVYWVAWQAELNYNTLAYCTHTHTIDVNRRKEKKAEYEYKFKVWDDGTQIEEDLPHNFEDYKVTFLHKAANVMDFRPKGAWLSADITFEPGNEITA
jgi:two-component sensor histidine kinase